KCEKCQKHGDVHIATPTELNSLATPWSFYRWGMNILGPFKMAPGQLKYLIVAIDYCTKWIKQKHWPA
ncbi:gypsy retrotransposon integrase-like protein, partial [Trifolium medium]|nr:gypsy retrotransposon integrase-like protein [Trifolium medium]